MEMLNLKLPAVNLFATDYIQGTSAIQRFFHYRYQASADYNDRLSELKKRMFMREELSDVIAQYMKPFPSSREVEKSLEKLRDENSVVVIGGQQAGILTGPLYTIHKIISIIVYAKKLEAELHVPVVPLFWIAGEDHDYDEINHLYIENEGKIKKKVYPERYQGKKMVSQIPLQQEKALEWVEEIVAILGETEHTKQLLSFLTEAIQKSHSFTDFFAFMVMGLFKEEGLLLVDSAAPRLRELEKEIFLEQMKQASEITACVKEIQQEIALSGYPLMINISGQAANLFYHEPMTNERILLEYDRKRELFIGKNDAVLLSYEELQRIAIQYPERLSNNVVTRPLTQELLFPTIAFIAGPGEIAYWAELKKMFELFSVKMPPIVPRLNITLLERSIEADLHDLDLPLEEVLMNGTEKMRLDYLESVKDRKLHQLFSQTKENLCKDYQQIEKKLEEPLLPLFEKNREILMRQIEFMERKAESFLEKKHENRLRKYKRIENSLRPLGAPQERIHNALPYMNRYGLRFFARLGQLDYSFDGSHKIIRI